MYVLEKNYCSFLRTNIQFVIFSSVQFEEEIKGIGLKKDVVVFALFTFLFFLTPGIFILKF